MAIWPHTGLLIFCLKPHLVANKNNKNREQTMLQYDLRQAHTIFRKSTAPSPQARSARPSLLQRDTRKSTIIDP